MGLAAPKQFLTLGGVPLLVHTLKAFHAVPAIQSIILVVPAVHRDSTQRMVADYGLDRVQEVVVGGAERQDSVRAGLAVLPDGIDLVAVHDGARPLVSPQLIEACLDAAAETGAAIAAVPVKDTLKQVTSQGIIDRTIDRQGLWQAQTPQVVAVSLLREAHARAAAANFLGTDEASLLEHFGYPVIVVPGSEKNIKITRPEDLIVAKALLKKEVQTKTVDELRIGNGYDAHCLVPNRPLVLGGVTIPHDLGLLGHSDADVLTHALCDALLGALGRGDIGRLFPDTDAQFKDILSLRLLEEVMLLVAKDGYRLINADITVLAQRPKLAPHFPAMAKNLCQICRVPPERLNLKATTTEQMGFEGREEGIAAQAVVLLERC